MTANILGTSYEIIIKKYDEDEIFERNSFCGYCDPYAKEIILCEENRKNIEEIQPMYLTGLTFHYVKDIKEVLQLALTDEKVNGAIDFCNANQKSDEKK